MLDSVKIPTPQQQVYVSSLATGTMRQTVDITDPKSDTAHPCM
jgi:hypothetical protein